MNLGGSQKLAVFVIKGWDLKKGLFSFYPLCVQSELSLVKPVQKSKVRTVFKFSESLSEFNASPLKPWKMKLQNHVRGQNGGF